MRKYAVILPLLLVLNGYLNGQESETGYLKGFLYVDVATDVRNIQNVRVVPSVDGAVVTLITATDTFYTVVIDGGFFFNHIPLGKVKVIVTHLSFETAVEDVDIEKRTFVTITLKEKAVILPEFVIKGEAPLVIMRGDTLIYNAAAVKLMEGDEAIEILKQMPGVEISESGIRVLGKNVKRTYVNSRLVFGRNEMTALMTLPASEVVSINTYEEYENPDSLSHHAGDKKVQVLNIKTKNPIFSVTAGHALASLGHDFDPAGHNRYSIGATGNFFSEALLFSVNAFTNNVDRQSNRMSEAHSVSKNTQGYNTKNYVNVGSEKLWGKDPIMNYVKLGGGYIYERTYTLTGNKNQDIYLPTTMYASREYSDILNSKRTSVSHVATLNLEVMKPNMSSLQFNNSFRKFDSESEYERQSASMLNGNILRNHAQSNTAHDGYVLVQSLSMHTSGRKSVRFSFNVNYERTVDDGDNYRIDSLTSTGLKKIVESGPLGVSNTFGISGGLNFKLHREKSHTLKLNYKFGNENNRRQRFAFDVSNVATQIIDTVNTYHYTNNSHSHRASLGFMFYLNENKQDFIEIESVYQLVGTNRDEQFPDEWDFRRRQDALLPSLTIRKTWRDFSNSQFTYNTSTALPSLEQWRSQLDNRNPYQLIAGNPGLKQSYTHRFKLNNYFFGKKGNNLVINAEVNIISNVIAEKVTYFTHATLLPKWNFNVLAQSNFIEYENLDERIMGNLSIGYDRIVGAIRSKLSTGVRFFYDQYPSYIQDQLTKTKNYTPAMYMLLRGNFSQIFKLTININANYTYSENTRQQYAKILNLTGGLTTVWHPFKWIIFEASYRPSYYKNYTSRLDAGTTTHILNAVAGCKLWKGNVELSVAAYDVLNRNTGFRTTMTQDYIRNTWTQSFGRYFTFNIAYKFFKSKSGLKSPSGIRLQDGGVKEAVGGGSMQVQ